MSTVETVRGPVDVAELGPTLMHEHIFVLDPEALAELRATPGARATGTRRCASPTRSRSCGGCATAASTRSSIRASPGLGRYIPRIQRINAEVDLNIVVATGVYQFLELPSFLAYRSDDVITELFVREIREGIDDTGVKAAFLKCAVEQHGLIGDVPRILAAVAAASVETGAPVMVHTNAVAQTGLLALEALTGAGVEPARIVIAHAGDSNDLGYLRAIADTGASLGCDRFSIAHFNPDAEPHRDARGARGRGLRGQRAPRARRRVLLRLHVPQPDLRRREAGLPPHLARTSSRRCSRRA